MKNTVEHLSETRVKLTVEVDKTLWEEHQHKAFHKLAKNVKVDGFRPGKAPESMLRARISQGDIWNEAIETILTPVYAQALMEEKLEPFARPEVNVPKVTTTSLTVEYTFVLAPSVKLGQYKGLSAPKTASGVTEEEINESITKMLEGNADLVVVDREAKEGDTLNLDFKGFTANEEGKLEAFEGGEAKNYSLVLGSHSFIPGFEEALVGVKTGEKKSIKVTFPEAYVASLAGKEATFECLVHEIKEKVVPELNDEAVEDLGLANVSTVEQLKEHQKETLLAQKLSQAENSYYNAIIDKIVKGSTFAIDESIYDNEVAARVEQFHQQLEQQGLTEQQYFEITSSTADDLKAQYRKEAEPNIKAYLALHEIGHEEKLEPTEEDVNEEIKKLAEQYHMEEKEIRGYVEKDLDNWKHSILDRKIREFILANSEVEASKKPSEPKEKAEEKKTETKKAPAKKSTAKKESK